MQHTHTHTHTLSLHHNYVYTHATPSIDLYATKNSIGRLSDFAHGSVKVIKILRRQHPHLRHRKSIHGKYIFTYMHTYIHTYMANNTK